MTQKEQILSHLKTGRSITPYEAIIEYGTISLQYHVFRLRKEGYKIVTNLKSNLNGKRYASYRLVKEG